MDRRLFLASSLAGAMAGTTRGGAAGSPVSSLPFDGLAPSTADHIVLPPGYHAQPVAVYGDLIGEGWRDGNPQIFGYNASFAVYVPIDARLGGARMDRGLLCVGHEYPNPLMQHHALLSNAQKVRSQIEVEMYSVGLSIFEVRRGHTGGDFRWFVVKNSRYNRRISALGPDLPFGREVRRHARARGTLANSAAATTPWHSVLVCEQDFAYAYGDSLREPFSGHMGWEAHHIGTPFDYGWMVEVDPFGELPDVKRTALGRFEHGGCAFRLTPDRRLVVYMSDGAADQCLYKFVSSWRMTGDRRRDHAAALEQGVLFVADSIAGRWRPLAFDENRPAWRAQGFASQIDILVNVRRAARVMGGTPMDRPEGISVNPRTGNAVIAFTNNLAHGNIHGFLLELVEEGGRADADRFDLRPVALGGRSRVAFSCPTDVRFDKKGRLWFSVDVMGAHRGVHAERGNNALYVLDEVTPEMRPEVRFASAPVAASFSGASFNGDESTMFVAVQHPGEDSLSPRKPTSRWPGRSGSPSPGVVAICRIDGQPVGG